MTRLVAILVNLTLLAAGLVACAPSLPPGTRECVGFPADVCQRQLVELEREGIGHGGVAGYRIVCTSGSCTSSQGEGTETVVFADGTGRDRGFGYAVPIGMPTGQTFGPLPIEPVCLGVPAEWCLEMARTGAENVADWSSIVAITVRCTGSCTTSSGDGETRVRLIDGSEQAITGWNYNGEIGPDSP